MNTYRKRSYRQNHGNMLILGVLVMFLIVMIVAQASSFIAMLIAHQRLQDEAEGFEMRAANVLNKFDRTGRINLMTAASRELVFDSRQVSSRIADSSPQFNTLAAFYMDQSREGALAVAKEREKILSSTLSELRELAQEIDQRNQCTNILPWASTNNASILDLDVGYAKDEESNVTAPEGNADLLTEDEQHKYFDRDTRLYFGNVSLKLPGPDDDLDFKLSCLPAPVVDTVPQAHFETGKTFVKTLTLIQNNRLVGGTCEYFPSNVRITFARDFQNSLGVKSKQQIAASVAATTNGTNPPPI